ncbi:hypothetical protein IQ238_20875 [Pleurocapsales cyanobacterium LEGE 06147]|nr:hypothetical protein [Pleurocapsales cyanobacterium LEGE 06147]
MTDVGKSEDQLDLPNRASREQSFPAIKLDLESGTAAAAMTPQGAEFPKTTLLQSVG